MSWSYTTGILTSSGATETSPDSLLAGIAIVQAADATRGSVINRFARLTNVRVDVGNGSWVKFDNDSTIEFAGSTRLNPVNETTAGANNGGSSIFGLRSVIMINTTTLYFDFFCRPAGNGGSFVSLRSPSGINPLVIQQTVTRNDFPTFDSALTPNKIDIGGLTIINNGSSRKLYFGLARNLVNARNVSFETTTGEYHTAQTTYNNSVFPSATHSGDNFANTSNFFNTEWGTEQTGSISFTLGNVRLGNYYNFNPLFPTATWNGTYSGTSFDTDNRYAKTAYTNKTTFKVGTTLLTGVNARWSGEVYSASPYAYNLANAGESLLKTQTTNGTGIIETYLLSALIGREGGSLRASNKYRWNLKARNYAYKTASENVYENKILLPEGNNGALIEEVQMISVPNLTLTEAQANALTGISLVGSGATGGTVTLSSARTVSELWQYYRAWISQTANFGSDDTWSYDGTTLNIGGWTVTGIEFLTGGTIVTSTATANGTISNLSITGNVSQTTPTNLSSVTITGTLTYNTNTATSITITNTTIGTVANSGTGIVTITPTNSTITTYTDAEINYLDSSLNVIGATSVTAYPTATDRNNNTNAIKTWNGTTQFKYSGVWANPLFLKLDIGFVAYKDVTLTLGANEVDLGTTGLLANIQSTMAKQTSLEIVNNGVKKASKLIPHNTNL